MLPGMPPIKVLYEDVRSRASTFSTSSIWASCPSTSSLELFPDTLTVTVCCWPSHRFTGTLATTTSPNDTSTCCRVTDQHEIHLELQIRHVKHHHHTHTHTPQSTPVSRDDSLTERWRTGLCPDEPERTGRPQRRRDAESCAHGASDRPLRKAGISSLTKTIINPYTVFGIFLDTKWRLLKLNKIEILIWNFVQLFILSRSTNNNKKN